MSRETATTERHIVETVAREIAADHYATRFKKLHDDPHVQMNVDGNWRFIGLPQVRAVLASLEAHGYAVPVGWEEVQ